MKKLSKDERLGAVVLSAVVILVLGAMAFFRSCETKNDSGESSTINVIYDSKEEGDKEFEDGNRQYVRKKASGGSRNSKRSGGSKASGRQSSARSSARSSATKSLPEPPRDFLDDTIPLEYNDNLDW